MTLPRYSDRMLTGSRSKAFKAAKWIPSQRPQSGQVDATAAVRVAACGRRKSCTCFDASGEALPIP
jgi:hypothetical protein